MQSDALLREHFDCSMHAHWAMLEIVPTDLCHEAGRQVDLRGGEVELEAQDVLVPQLARDDKLGRLDVLGPRQAGLSGAPPDSDLLFPALACWAV